MTTCALITKPITRMVDEGKTIDEIADGVCPTIKYGRAKIIRVIKDFLGEEYLIEHAESLKYDIDKAQLAKTKKTHKKNDATTDDDNVKPDEDELEHKETLELTIEELIEQLEQLIKHENFMDALEIIMQRHKKVIKWHGQNQNSQ